MISDSDPSHGAPSVPRAPRQPYLGLLPTSASSSSPPEGSDSQLFPFSERRRQVDRRQQTDRRLATNASTAVAARLAAVQTGLQGQRDPTTGLPDARVLARALRTLRDSGSTGTVLTVHLWSSSAAGMGVSTADEADILRAACAALRGMVRRHDVVCRLEGVSFAVVVPHVAGQAADLTLLRAREAMTAVRRQFANAKATLHTAIGMGFCDPLTPPMQPLATAWREMIAMRQAREAPTARRAVQELDRPH